MKLLQWFIVACIVYAALKAALSVLLVLVALAVLWGVFFRPAETFGFMALLIVSVIVQAQPVLVVLVFGFGWLIKLMRASADSASNSKGVRTPNVSLPPPAA